MKRLVLCTTMGLALTLVLLGLPALAQQDALGVFFLFDRSGSMSQEGIDSELRHGSQTGALLDASDSAGGGFFAAFHEPLAPLGDPILASQAFTAALGTSPEGGTNLLEGLNDAESQLDAFSGQRVILIYGDGCTSDSEAVETKVGQLESSGYLLAYIQLEGGCSHLDDDIDLYYLPSAVPAPEELIRVLRPVPVGVRGTLWYVPRGELVNIKWNAPITVTWSHGHHTALTTLQKENEVTWGELAPQPGDGSTLLAFNSPNDTGIPLTYTVPFSWNGFSGEHTVVVAEGGRPDHLGVFVPPTVAVGQPFTFTVSIVDPWGNPPAVLPSATQDVLFRLGGSSTSMKPSTWTWQAGAGATQTFTATCGQVETESLEFLLEGGLRGWSNTFEAVDASPGPYRVYAPIVTRTD